MVVIGLIGGSGLLKANLAALQGLTEETVDTAHGRVFLRTGRLAGHTGATLVFVQRHDARSSREYTQPADINYAAIALALKAKVRVAALNAEDSAEGGFDIHGGNNVAGRHHGRGCIHFND